MPLIWSNWSASAYLRFRPNMYDVHEKTLFLTTFFHKLTKRITSENDTAGKMEPTCCPAIRSTGINPQLVVPVGYKALTVLQFWIFSVQTLGPKKSKTAGLSVPYTQRAQPIDGLSRYAHQTFGTNVNFGGGYENAITFGLGFRNRWPDPSSETVRFCGKLIKFSAFFHFSQHWKGIFARSFHHNALFLL